jgi:PadR family transcriptional regulator PadR
MAPKGLTEIEQFVLMALIRQGRDAYGVTIADEITERARRPVSLGAVYKTLDRLETLGYVGSRLGEPTAERGGRRKKHFHALPAGQRALKANLATLQRMASGLESELGL